MNEILDMTKINLDEAVDSLEKRLQTIRAGRANPTMLDNIMVNYYGSSSPIKALANISVPEARELKIKPYDASALKDIEKAIIEANLGIMPTNNGEFIILTIPVLTEQTRMGYVKEAKGMCEDGKVAIRNIRQKSLKDLENLDISEDDIKHGEKRVQDLINDYNHKVDLIFKDKEKDLMSI